MAERLRLNSRPAPVPGPPLPGGKPRKKPYYPRPGRKKSDPKLVRSAKLGLRFTPEVREWSEGLADHAGMEMSPLVYSALVHYAAMIRHKVAAPPWDPKAAQAAPTLPGLDRAGEREGG